MSEVDLDLLSDSELAQLATKLNSVKLRSKRLQSLFNLSVNVIINNLGTDRNRYFRSALGRVPATLVQTVLKSSLNNAMHVKLELVLLMLTENLTEFDFEWISEEHASTFDAIANISVCLHNLKKNCPKIGALRICWPRELQFDFPLNHLAQWNHLKFLSARDFIFDQNCLQLLAQIHKELETLEMSIFISSWVLVSAFAEFENLRKLSILGTIPKDEKVGKFRERTVNKLFAAIAASVPKLSHFHFELSERCPSRGSDGFIEELVTFDRCSKDLHLLELKVFNLMVPWPASDLSLGKLTVYGDFLDSNPDTIDNLRTIPTENLHTLELNEVDAEFLYQILRLLGGKVQNLVLHWSRPPVDLNMYKILQMCPRLVSVSVDEFSTAETLEGFELSPQFFNQMREFNFYRSKSEIINRYHNSEIFKQFLIGSSNLNPKLHVFVGELLPAVLNALECDSNSLKNVTDLELDVQFPEQIPILAKIAKVMIQRAQCLREIKIGCQALVSERRMKSFLEGNFTKLASELQVKLQFDCSK